MDDSFDNPFSVTRAADFTDEQIHDYWVDLSDGGGFFGLIKPRLEMPMLVLGGKGSGKTHIMRYLSFPLQKLRSGVGSASAITSEGYIGIYMRCSGLNSARFRGKRQSAEVWRDVFAYYLELWLAQMTIDTCCQALQGSSTLQEHGSLIAQHVKELFDTPAEPFPTNVQDLGEHLRMLQRELDVAINNCAFEGSLSVTLRASSGRLIFGIPRVLAAIVAELKDSVFVYLIDEFENLTEPQQKLVNTLIREKENPASFKIGARLYGMRTYSTYSADEDIKEGSEYELLPLDVRLRTHEQKYESFARELVARRLVTRGFVTCVPGNAAEMKAFVSNAFERPQTDGLAEGATQFVIEKYAGRERPYFKSLRQALQRGMKAGFAPGIAQAADTGRVIERLACPAMPLLEKLNCFMFYQEWSAKGNLLDAAGAIQLQCGAYCRNRDTATPYHDKLLHWKADLLAQLRRECGHKQTYAGFDTLIELSWGNPRHLLILLKHVFSWAVFNGERPFGDKPISVKAQGKGVREAAEWFFRDARMPGSDGKLVQDAIARLATLFRSIRYSDKPSECSLSTFSYEPASASSETRRLIDLAEKRSLLVYVGGQHDRNSERVDTKFQINRMLAPLWDISFSRRGALAISADDLNSIFDPSFTDQFETRLKARVERMTAPYFGAKPTGGGTADTQQTLPGMGDD